MPGGDRTGPVGLGPMTGRAGGSCAGYPVPGFMNPTPLRGFGGRGRGFGGRGRGGWGRGGWGRGGWGRRNWFYATGLPGWARFGPEVPRGDFAAYGAPYPTFPASYGTTPPREQELDILRSQAAHFEETLAGIKKRIEELDAEEARQ